jgi:hypothetical protein
MVRILGYDLDLIQQEFDGDLPEALVGVERVVWTQEEAEAEAAMLVWYRAGEKSLPGYEPWPANLAGEE